jgi:hypothetical protein
MGKNIGYYPKGHINQHKALATGAGLRKGNTSNKETVPSPWGQGQSAAEGNTNIKSGTSTGSVGRGGTVSHKVTPA